MKLLKRFRTNVLTNTKTTKKGIWYSLFIAIIGTVVVEISKTRPELANIITENQELIYSVLALIIGKIVHHFGSKEDKS